MLRTLMIFAAVVLVPHRLIRLLGTTVYMRLTD
jgi:hypothetical protein